MPAKALGSRRTIASQPAASPVSGEQAGSSRVPGTALNCVQQDRTALNCTHPCLRLHVAAGQSRCGVLFPAEYSAVLRSCRQRSMSPGMGVCAGQGGEESLVGLALQLGADWVQVGEVVSAPEVLTGAGRRRGALTWGGGGRAVRRNLPVEVEVLRRCCSGWLAPADVSVRLRPRLQTCCRSMWSVAGEPAGVRRSSVIRDADPTGNVLTWPFRLESSSVSPKGVMGRARPRSLCDPATPRAGVAGRRGPARDARAASPPRPPSGTRRSGARTSRQGEFDAVPGGGSVTGAVRR
ncbi:hypothetical protein HNR20_000772 [Micromonospora parathelypteridis]|uniref:Uncharacterized protein n=1 Tax=Micromonospora parathelypteridis TaxID=1839617 RepID=A0A840VHN7_9ACTN|nr:hypothetical protein [Micromonospora parathelypteridis]